MSGPLLRGSRLNFKSGTFAGYDWVISGQTSIDSTTTIGVPMLKACGHKLAGAAATTGVYLNNSDSTFTSAGLAFGCDKGKAEYFPVLYLNGAGHEYPKLKAKPGDTVVLTVDENASATTVSVADKTHKSVHKSLSGGGGTGLTAPWLGISAGENANGKPYPPPDFGKVSFSASFLDGEAWAARAEGALQGYNRYKGKTLEIKTGPFASNDEGFSTVFKHP